MAERKSVGSRPGSPAASSKSPVKRERRYSAPHADKNNEGVELQVPRPSDKKEHDRMLNSFASPYEPPNAPRLPATAAPTPRPGPSNPKRRPRPQPRDTDGDAEDLRRDRVTLHDIRQSLWIEDLNKHAPERIYLTIEHAPLAQMSTIDTEFCWVHHQRNPENMHFEDFVRIVNNTPLYQHEHDVALKTLREVESMRHVFAKGKYLNPLVHGAKNCTETIAGKKAEVKATFISMPIFSSMECGEPHPAHRHHPHASAFFRALQVLFDKTYQLVHEEEDSKDHHKDLATKELHKHDGHPIRSLMQYKNILAVDNTRDWQQAIIRLGDWKGEKRPFIHVPELWVLIINMYTIVTCAPLSVEQLEGDNIIHRSPEKEDMRVNVKYTNLNGALHEFRCRTWLGLRNTIASIEHQIDSEEELSVQLGKEESLYRLVDVKFRLIDRKRWIRLTSSSREKSKVYVRLVKLGSESLMNVAYSTRKADTFERLVWQLMRYQVVSEHLRDQLRHSRKRGLPLKQTRPIEERLDTLRTNIAQTKKERLRQRFLYGAARYHLIDPGGQLFDEDQTYQDAIRERSPLKKTDSAFSATGKDLRNQRNSEAGLPSFGSQEPSRNVSPDTRVNLLNANNPVGFGDSLKPQEKLKIKIPTRYNLNLQREVFERFQIPPPRQPQDLRRLNTLDTHSYEPPSQMNGFLSVPLQSPQRSYTSASLIANRKRQTPLTARAHRSMTMDVEAQVSQPSGLPRVTFTQAGPDQNPAPTFVVTREADDVVRRVGSAEGDKMFRPDVSEMSYIFRSRPQSQPQRPGSRAIAPLRLPLLAGNAKLVQGPGTLSETGPKSDGELHAADKTRFSCPTTQDASGAELSKATLKASQGLARRRLATMRQKKDLRQLQPFFMWKTAGVTPPATPRDSHQDQVFPSDLASEQNRSARESNGNEDEQPSTDPARHTLDVLHHQMTTGYFVSEVFQVRPADYAQVSGMSLEQVLSVLEEQHSDVKKEPLYQKAAQARWDTRMDLVLNVDSILRCFVGNDSQDKPIIEKIWGLVGAIVSIPADDIKRIDESSSDFAPNVLAWSKKEVGQMEQLCREILISARSDTGNRDEQLNLALPHAFLSQFRDIVLFLLAISLLPKDPKYYQEAVKELSNMVEEGWTECETDLARNAREFKEYGDNREYLNESIKTADTLLGLLLQNAFTISRSPSSEEDPNLPYCDLEHIYRRWTAVCHKRAIRKPSAQMYEEVRLLREELQVVGTVLKDQRRVFEQILEVRESPKQTLDLRVNKRMEIYLDDTIHHFETLEAYAKEAEALTTNYIRVHNEGNSKAIFIFTFFTVIFLPLNSISSILGMNVVDIRNTSRNSSLFWEISVPVMFFVLVFSLLLIKLNFNLGLRRKLGRYLLMFFPKSWESEHRRIKRESRAIPRQS